MDKVDRAFKTLEEAGIHVVLAPPPVCREILEQTLKDWIRVTNTEPHGGTPPVQFCVWLGRVYNGVKRDTD